MQNAGKISHDQAIEKVNKEYEKFKVKQDMKYISSMDKISKIFEREYWFY